MQGKNRTNTIPKDDLINTADAAKILGVTTRTIRNRVAAGHLTKYRIGSRVFFKKEQIRNLLFNPKNKGE